MRKVSPSIAYRLFYPQVPMIICSRHSREIAAMPANSCIPISDSPPLVCVAINRKSRTNRVISKSNLFSINWLDYSNQEIVKELALSFQGENKLKALGIDYKIEARTPIITSCTAYAICKVIRKIRTGDHDLFVGLIQQVHASRDFGEYWGFRKYRPLLYLGSDKESEYTSL